MTVAFGNQQKSLAITLGLVEEGIYPPGQSGSDPHAYSQSVTMGAIRMFAGDFAIGGDLANGAIVPISQQTALFSLLLTNYGGNGQSTFALPNLLDRMPVGIGTGTGLSTTVTLAEQFGATDVTLTQGQLPGPFGTSQSFDNYQPALGLNYFIKTAGPLPLDQRDVNNDPISTSAFIGTVEAYAIGFTPDGYLPADGRILNVADFPRLFGVIGNTFGGNGTTTFALPDLRGRTAIGASVDHPLGTYLGDDDPTVATGNLPPSLGGSSQPIDNHEPSLALQYLIAVEGVYPTRNGHASGGQEPYLGEVILFAGTDIPDGWVPADGRLLAINQNQALFSLLLNFYGGNGQTTFALPDLRDRAAIGGGGQYFVGTVVGSDGIVLTDANIPPGAPVVTTSIGVTGVNEQVTVAIDPTLVLVDYDSATLASATVTITGNFHSGEDILAFVNDGASMGNIAAAYNAATGVLTLTSLNATATVAQWQSALRAVTFTDTSDTPDTSARNISFSASDGSHVGGAAIKTVAVAAVNDAPVAQDGSAAGDQDTTITGTLVATDPDSPSLTYAGVAGAAHGSVTVNADGTFSYTPDAGYEGVDSFTFRANDGAADSNVATIHLIVGAPPFQYAASTDLGSHGAAYAVAGVGDFNGDGTTDVLWRNTTTGQIDEWKLINGNWSASIGLGSHGPGWSVATTGDINGDGTSDVLWREASSGKLEAWIMVNGQWSSSVDLGSHGADWQVLGTGDFNGDGTSDILFRNTTTGAVDEWLMSGGNWSASKSLGSYNTAWSFGGIGDLNGDGTSDILWRNPTTGAVDAWQMQNGNWSKSTSLGSFDPAFDLAAVNDFNGDGTADVLWRNPTTGQVEGWVMADGQWHGSVSLGSFDPAWRLAGSGDFNHSGSADVLWHNAATGQTSSWLLA